MSFALKPATRTGVKMLIGLYGKSGSGKTLTGLFVARGIVGPKGRITIIDTESGRGSLFADVVPGGYSVIEIDPPFSPERYKEAFETAETQSDCIIVDSLTHEHNGEGGVLDMQEAELDRMAGNNWEKREACKMASWIKPKIAHKKFIQRLLRSKVPLICCLRGEEKTHITKEQGQKTKVFTDEFSTPLFDPRFIFELLVNFETVQKNGQGGFVVPRKITHPSIRPILPTDDEQLGIKHGEAIARWCAAPGASPARVMPPLESNMKALKRDLWTITKPIHKGDKSKLEEYLVVQEIISDTEALDDFTAVRLVEIIDALKGKVAA